MSTPISQRLLSCMIPTLLLVISHLLAPINGFESRRVDETSIPGSSNDPSVKCGGCSPCGHPSCYSRPPPPSLPPPKKPPTTSPYCPPPPYNPGFVYISAPPGELYPVVQNYSKSQRNLAASLKITLGFGLLAFLIVWT